MNDNTTSIETWKDVVGYEGLYMISSHGRVRSVERTILSKDGRFRRIPERILTIHLNPSNGRYQANLSSGQRKLRWWYVHRLIGLAFIPNPESKQTINHKDGNPRNNRLENLEWATHRENSLHAHKHGLNKGRKGQHNELLYNSTPVVQKTLSGEVVKIYPSIAEAERDGFSKSAIWCCCNGQRRYKSTGGFRWEYGQKTVSWVKRPPDTHLRARHKIKLGIPVLSLAFVLLLLTSCNNETTPVVDAGKHKHTIVGRDTIVRLSKDSVRVDRPVKTVLE